MNDGTIPLPLIGSVRVSEITLQQAMFWIKELMGQQLFKPDLQPRVVKPRPMRVALVGEVERPGPTLLMAKTPLVQVIMAAWGLKTWRASKSNVEMLRINRNGSATREKF